MMDRALQERITGAIVLVVIAVLVVPVFLDGPANDTAIVSESVTLPGQEDRRRRQQTIVLERDRSEPVPTSTAPRAQQRPESSAALSGRDRSVVEAAATPSGSQAAPAASASSESATGMWAVQLGSFSNQENAERLAADLRGQGYAAFLSQLRTNGGSLHRVRIGPQKDRAGAEDVAEKLGAAGLSGQVVPHP